MQSYQAKMEELQQEVDDLQRELELRPPGSEHRSCKLGSEKTLNEVTQPDDGPHKTSCDGDRPDVRPDVEPPSRHSSFLDVVKQAENGRWCVR